MTLSRQNIKLYDEIQSSLAGNSDSDVGSLLGQIHLLAALRASSEADSQSLAMSRAASSSKPSRNAKRGKNDTSSIMSAEDRDSIAADSPAPGGPTRGPSPKVQVPATTRLKVHAGGSRAGSVPAGREASVKIEDGEGSGVEVAGIGKGKALEFSSPLSDAPSHISLSLR
jgi:SAGA-associated factor 29